MKLPNMEGKRVEFKERGIDFEERDGRIWVSLTDMANAENRGMFVGNWKRKAEIQNLLYALETAYGHPVLTCKTGNLHKHERGTWAIEEIALVFDVWLKKGNGRGK